MGTIHRVTGVLLRITDPRRMLAHGHFAAIHRHRDIAVGDFLDRMHQDRPGLVLRQTSDCPEHLRALLCTGNSLDDGRRGIWDVLWDRAHFEPPHPTFPLCRMIKNSIDDFGLVSCCEFRASDFTLSSTQRTADLRVCAGKGGLECI
jgi:hypothetical protein